MSNHFDGGASDQQAEYAAAALRKAGLPETLEVAEMRLRYAVGAFRDGELVDVCCQKGHTREDAEQELGSLALPDGWTQAIVVWEVISMVPRRVTP